MPTPLNIAAKIWRGYGIAAKHLAPPAQIYRPTDPLAPIGSGSLINTLPASFALDTNYLKPNRYGNAVWRTLIDARFTLVGDYIVDYEDISWFIIEQHIDLPIISVQCNCTASFYTPQQQTATGENPYGGNTLATETLYLQNWPVSILQGLTPIGGAPSKVGLPGDTTEPRWNILLPVLPDSFDIQVIQRDIVIDSLGRRFAIEAAEISEFGYRIKAQQVLT